MQDDPVCVAARLDKKKVVTDQWVEDSFELGELADADRVNLASLLHYMLQLAYLPLASLCVCIEQ